MGGDRDLEPDLALPRLDGGDLVISLCWLRTGGRMEEERDLFGLDLDRLEEDDDDLLLLLLSKLSELLLFRLRESLLGERFLDLDLPATRRKGDQAKLTVIIM